MGTPQTRLAGDAPLRAGADKRLKPVSGCLVTKGDAAQDSQDSGKNETSLRAVSASSLIKSRFANHCEVALDATVKMKTS